MPRVQRQCDANSVGGLASAGVPSVRVNGRPIVVVGTPVAAHAPWARRPHPPHASTVTAGGVASVRAGNKPVIVDCNIDICGHPRVCGSPNVKAG